ncbi:hypothetical protein H2509_13450 [Stappia sp. F7233]|uniref:Holin of 3TMs, for gene-transfer release n=1 Tax=Stappia albiluteola TaxID=2758565 RepID=A0A839AEJ8_9HYPH|nr:hypothetical protein [Stappia albiluteola]MBA5777458.1 hypothetical protein [Stappia albiluteola]MBA5777496.1 hypothetical protein [Stappia albiluteola]MBA5778093.1 hypothetical protein [Stappia albiluteola]MBA5778130.1 hypothetical protein [Stappia albiluteola]
MSMIVGILAGVASKVGAELVGRVLGERFGEAGGRLAETVVSEIAGVLGVEPEELPSVNGADLEEAVETVEGRMPELIALWSRGLDGQFALLQAEQRQGIWQSGWRWGWMYLLGLMWTVRLLIVPVTDAIAGTDIGSRMDMGVMMTLTSWFVALYMGGHTLKNLGAQGVEAIKAMKGK